MMLQYYYRNVPVFWWKKENGMNSVDTAEEWTKSDSATLRGRASEEESGAESNWLFVSF